MAMTSTMVFLFLALSALAASFERLHGLLQLEESSLRVATGSDGVAEALGMAIARMHTGLPPDSAYVCRERLRSSDGEETLAFRITHTRIADDHWIVSVEPSGADDPDCPSFFDTSCVVAGP